MYGVLNWIYHLLIAVLVLFLGWNALDSSDRRTQVMSAVVLLPFVLRLFNLK